MNRTIVALENISKSMKESGNTEFLLVASTIGLVVVTIGLVIFTYIVNRKQLFIQNFSEITSHVGDELTKLYRKWLHYDNNEMNKLFKEFKSFYDEKYETKSSNEKEKYKVIEKGIWHLASRYDRVGVLLQQ